MFALLERSYAMTHATYEISAIICTHNPRHDYLKRTLDGLRLQSLPQAQWELVVVDNASDARLADNWDLGWHVNARHIQEDRLGLTHARACGINELVADLIIFVDDDAVLDPNYLARALQIDHEWPILGAWGGQWFPEFEVEPDEEQRRRWTRSFTQDFWSNLPLDTAATPWGAGMCVRRKVAEAYLGRLASNPELFGLDRKGSQLFAAGDIDLALTSCDLGLGTGTFAALKLTHLIPASRLEESYVLRCTEAMACSHVLFNYFRGEVLSRPSRSQKLLHWYEGIHLTKRERRLEVARRRGRELALKEIERIQRAEASRNEIPS